MTRPQNVEEYKCWLRDKRHVDVTEKTCNYYDTVTRTVKTAFEKSPFWTDLGLNLKEYDAQYLIRDGYRLLASTSLPELGTKPFDSFLQKTYRKNVLENFNWPSQPEGGWILPDNWFPRINDIVRTCLVVKYLDGVRFILDAMHALCDQHGITSEESLEAREEGYYAAHLYVRQDFEVPKIDWDTKRINVAIEIQITTQLQEVIRKLLHKYYEKRRIGVAEHNSKWQWDYSSDEFAANYLGHILHYVEGMIMDVRRRQKEVL